MAWLTGWNKRKSHVINAATGAGTNYQVCIKVYKTTGTDGTEAIGGITAGKIYVGSSCRDDFGDIRFTDDDGTTLIDCWMESYVSGTSAIFWVEIADSLESSNQTIYVYYSKSDATYPYLATDLAQGNATFLFFDNFEDSSYDTNKWTTEFGTPTEANGYLRVGSTDNCKVRSKNTLGTVLRLKMKARRTSSVTIHSALGFQLADNTQYSIFWVLTGGVYRLEDVPDERSILTGPTVNVWYLHELCWKGSTSTKWYTDNGSALATHTSVPSTTTQIDFEAHSSSNTDIEWVFVAKYLATEPAHSTWGNEETEAQTYNQSCTQTLSSTGTNPLFNIRSLKAQTLTTTPINPLFNIKPLKVQTLVTSESRLLGIKLLLIQSLTGTQILSSIFYTTLVQAQNVSDSFLLLARKVGNEISSFAGSISSYFLFNLQSTLNAFGIPSFLDSINGQETILFNDSISSITNTFLEEMSSFLEEIKIAFSLSLQSSLNIAKSLFFKTSSFFSELLGVSETNNFFFLLSPLAEGFTFLDFFFHEFSKSIENSFSISDSISSSVLHFCSETMNMLEETLLSFLSLLLEYFLMGEVISDVFTKLEENSHSFVSNLLLETQLETGEALSFFETVTNTLGHLLSIQVEDFLSFAFSLSFTSQIVLDRFLQLTEMISKKVFLSVKSTFSFLDSASASLYVALYQEINELLSFSSSIRFSSQAFLKEISTFIETTSKKFSFHLQSVLSFLSSVSNFKFIGFLLPEILTTFDSALSFSVRKILQNIMNLDSQVKLLSRRILIEGFAFLDTVGIFRFLTIVREIRILLRNTPVYTKLKNYYTKIRKRDFGND